MIGSPMRLGPLVLCLLPLLPTLAQETVTVRFEARGSIPARLVLRLTAPSDPSSAQTAELVDGRGLVSVPAGSEWDVTSGDDAFWIAPKRITATGESTTFTLDLWPTATIKGRVSVAGEGKKPDNVSLVVESLPGQNSDIARGTKFTCPAEANGGFVCAVPAAARHLVVRVPEMTPHYLWDLRLQPRQQRDIGTIALRRGASFSAYLDKDVAQAQKTPVRARIVRPVAALPSENAARLSVPVAEADFDKRGFVQLAPLPAGTYNLEIGGKGFATRTIGPVEIHEGKETTFRKAIELFPPVRVRIAIDPPRDAGDRPWRIRWERMADFAPAGAGVTLQSDPNGQAVIDDQSPGLFGLKILDADGSPLWQKDVRVEEHDLSIPVTLDLHIVEGKVTLGDTPIEAALWFGTKQGSVHARAASDAEGAFTVRLPKLGEWPVEVVSDAHAIRSIVNVDIGEKKRVVIALPETLVSGWVVDRNGERLGGGRVFAGTSGVGVTAELDAAGEFTLRGLPEGRTHLVARSLSGDGSEAVALQLKSGTPLRGVELRILATQRVGGTVVPAGQPVAGAQVTVFPQLPPGGAVAEAVTDLAGTFEVRMPERTTRFLVVIGAPNRTLQTFEMPASERAARYDIAPAGGTLEVRLDAEQRFTIARDGVSVPLTSLFGWVLAHGIPLDDAAHLRFPDLAPGHYQACNAASQCAGGVLAPGATLALRVP